jgi:hypothetical protein
VKLSKIKILFGRLLFLFQITSIFYINLFSQNNLLRGKVLDSEGKKVSGAFIILKSINRSFYSNDFGNFQIKNIPAGKQTLEIHLVDYKVLVDNFDIKTRDTLEKEFVLTTTNYTMQALEIYGERKINQPADLSISSISLNLPQIKSQAGAVEDVLRSMQKIPGISAQNDFSSQLIVRGSSPDENLMLFDGIEVFNPYRLYGLISMFNPETVEEVNLTTGGFPAKYSDRLSSVLEVNNRDGSKEKRNFRGSFNLSLSNLNFVGEGAFKLKVDDSTDSSNEYYDEVNPSWNGSWLISTRRTYYDLIAEPLVINKGWAKGNVTLPMFQDFQFKLTIQPHFKHKIIFTGVTNKDQTELSEAKSTESYSSTNIKDINFNDAVGLKWIYTYSNDKILQSMISFYQNGGSNNYDLSQNSSLSLGLNLSTDDFNKLKDSLKAKGFNVPDLLNFLGSWHFLFQKFTLKSELMWLKDDHIFEFGACFDYINTDFGIGMKFDEKILSQRLSNFELSAVPENFENYLKYIRLGLYAQDKFKISNQLIFYPGLRFDYFGNVNKAYLSPRLSLSYSPAIYTTLKMGFGKYYQSPGYEKFFFPSFDFTFGEKSYGLTNEVMENLKCEEALHYIFSWDLSLFSSFHVQTQAYYKKFINLIFPNIIQDTSYFSRLIDRNNISKVESWSDPTPEMTDILSNTPGNNSKGESYGIEFMLEKYSSGEVNNFYGFITYAYSFANRIVNGVKFPFKYDRRHNLNLNINYRFSRWFETNISFSYGSGYPNTSPIGIKPRIYTKENEDGSKKTAIDNDWMGVVFIPEMGGLNNLYKSRLPDYQRLDFRVSAYPNWYNLYWVIYLDIMNLYNHKNTGYELFYVDRNTLKIKKISNYMFPVLPSIGVQVKF